MYAYTVVRRARIQALRPVRAAPLPPVRQEQRVQGVYEETRLTKGRVYTHHIYTVYYVYAVYYVYSVYYIYVVYYIIMYTLCIKYLFCT